MEFQAVANRVRIDTPRKKIILYGVFVNYFVYAKISKTTLT